MEESQFYPLPSLTAVPWVHEMSKYHRLHPVANCVETATECKHRKTLLHSARTARDEGVKKAFRYSKTNFGSTPIEKWARAWLSFHNWLLDPWHTALHAAHTDNCSQLDAIGTCPPSTRHGISTHSSLSVHSGTTLVHADDLEKTSYQPTASDGRGIAQTAEFRVRNSASSGKILSDMQQIRRDRTGSAFVHGSRAGRWGRAGGTGIVTHILQLTGRGGHSRLHIEGQLFTICRRVASKGKYRHGHHSCIQFTTIFWQMLKILDVKTGTDNEWCTSCKSVPLNAAIIWDLFLSKMGIFTVDARFFDEAEVGMPPELCFLLWWQKTAHHERYTQFRPGNLVEILISFHVAPFAKGVKKVQCHLHRVLKINGEATSSLRRIDEEAAAVHSAKGSSSGQPLGKRSLPAPLAHRTRPRMDVDQLSSDLQNLEVNSQ
ncbi:hypothetical protein K438DRAFT_1784009 [Mycena galopus ATCC 62051]|nr:hypothetical protein K438DRAFT_1784009 [Mycena galopus ATCC 62051]